MFGYVSQNRGRFTVVTALSARGLSPYEWQQLQLLERQLELQSKQLALQTLLARFAARSNEVVQRVVGARIALIVLTLTVLGVVLSQFNNPWVLLAGVSLFVFLASLWLQNDARIGDLAEELHKLECEMQNYDGVEGFQTFLHKRRKARLAQERQQGIRKTILTGWSGFTSTAMRLFYPAIQTLLTVGGAVMLYSKDRSWNAGLVLLLGVNAACVFITYVNVKHKRNDLQVTPAAAPA